MSHHLICCWACTRRARASSSDSLSGKGDATASQVQVVQDHNETKTNPKANCWHLSDVEVNKSTVHVTYWPISSSSHLSMFFCKVGMLIWPFCLVVYLLVLLFLAGWSLDVGHIHGTPSWKRKTFSAESNLCWIKTCASENIFPKILDWTSQRNVALGFSTQGQLRWNEGMRDPPNPWHQWEAQICIKVRAEDNMFPIKSSNCNRNMWNKID